MNHYLAYACEQIGDCTSTLSEHKRSASRELGFFVLRLRLNYDFIPRNTSARRPDIVLRGNQRYIFNSVRVGQFKATHSGTIPDAFATMETGANIYGDKLAASRQHASTTKLVLRTCYKHTIAGGSQETSGVVSTNVDTSMPPLCKSDYQKDMKNNL